VARPPLEVAREALGRARQRLLAARALVQDAEAALRRLRTAREAAAAEIDPRSPSEALAALDAQIRAADAALEAARADVRARRADQAEALSALTRADPRRDASRLEPGTPLLMLPVRLETRFKDGALWLRIYPDQWSVDAFDPRLSETEVESGQRFWLEWWRAAGEDDRRRAAWRGLVASHGVGRGGWILRAYAPLNPLDAPQRVGADDVVLVVPVTAVPSPAGQAAAAAYWTAVWRADGDGAAGAAAELALATAVDATAADSIRDRPPFNLDEAAPAGGRAGAAVIVAFCGLASEADLATRAASWTTPARSHLLPERFVATGFLGASVAFQALGKPVPPDLMVGPDPSAAPDEQLRIKDGRLELPEELRWLVDFDAAVAVGMAMRIPLTPETAPGVERLFVAGLRLGHTPDENARDLEDLLRRHGRSRGGLALVAQGTPTNNTEAAASGYDRLEDADGAFDGVFGTPPAPSADWDAKRDGQWLAEALGLDPRAFAGVAGGEHADQAEARAANIALWPATWGYFLDTMMHPVFDDRAVQAARTFFVGHVSGRGRLPAIRIGRQPYGVLVTTAFSRLEPTAIPGDAALDRDAVDVLQRLIEDIATRWRPLADGVARIGAAGDPDQVLLDVLALHPASVEFHQRYAESLADLVKRFHFDGLGGEVLAAFQAIFAAARSRDLLADLGWAGPDPDILGKLFHGAQHKLSGPLIDDRPLSETEAVRAYCDDGRNYLRWLYDASKASLDVLRRETGFSGDRRPKALLYLLLRHALLLAWYDAGERVRLEAGLIDAAAFKAERREPDFLHVAAGGDSESRYRALYSPIPRVTGDDRLLLAEHLGRTLGRGPSERLGEVMAAVDRLSGLPTARLERLLAEHLDCCSHRLDAWRLGLVHHRLAGLRGLRDGDETPPRRGIHLGCYGWLHDVRPESRALAEVELPEALGSVFDDPAAEPLRRDLANGGFVHAPSMNHAATAAVLRSGYLAHATPADPGRMAVNLSSERMRVAQSILEGVREGQTLGALLGYRFERGLHDRHGLAEVDWLIRHFRLAFPSPSDPDGRLVMDGSDFATHMVSSNLTTYPFGRADLPPVSTVEAQAVDLEAARLLDAHDALADLALAEGVHQAVLGNIDRAAATLDAFSKGGSAQEPAVLQTPRSGPILTHRVGLHLRAGLDPGVSPVPGLPMTPRAMAEPAVNEFLASQLPPPAEVAVRVTWRDRAGQPGERRVTQADLRLQPIDLLYLLHVDGQALRELDERILRHATTAEALPPDVEPTVEIRHAERLGGAATFFEVASLLEELRALVTRSRPLRGSDLAAGAKRPQDVDAAGARARPERPAAVLTALAAWQAQAEAFRVDLAAFVAGPPAQRRSGTDDILARMVDLQSEAARFGLPGCSWTGLAERRRAIWGQAVEAIAAITTRGAARLAEAAAQLARDAALPVTATAEERDRVLLLADAAVRAAPSDPIPADADAYRAAIIAQHDAYAARLAALKGLAPEALSLGELLAGFEANLPMSAFDPTPQDPAPFDPPLRELAQEIARRLAALTAEAAKRSGAAVQRLADHAAAAPGQARADAVAAATQALLGEDMVVVPEFVLPPAVGSAVQAAVAWSRSGQLTAHLDASRPTAVDDWLHGVARVRAKLRAFEQAALLAAALGRPEPRLAPIQLPHASEPWIGLEFAPGFKLTGERLLYTAHYPAAFDAAQPQCGLLIDEWTETIPQDRQTTGLAFHHDAPDQEAPQALLLMTPPTDAGWSWQDIMDTLHETLDMAALRAVEPSQVDATPFATLLPATVMAATVHGASIAANLAINNGLVRALGGADA
jgi:hypothetical protein